jgi:hypothetical protein
LIEKLLEDGWARIKKGGIACHQTHAARELTHFRSACFQLNRRSFQTVFVIPEKK